MTALEKQLTRALGRLSAQYETEQRRHSEQVEALRRQVEALREQVERQNARSETSKRQTERLEGQVTRLTECYGTLAAKSRGLRI